MDEEKEETEREEEIMTESESTDERETHTCSTDTHTQDTPMSEKTIDDQQDQQKLSEQEAVALIIKNWRGHRFRKRVESK